MVQDVSRRPLAAERRALAQSHTSQRAVCGGQGHNGTGGDLRASDSSCQHHSTSASPHASPT